MPRCFVAHLSQSLLNMTMMTSFTRLENIQVILCTRRNDIRVALAFVKIGQGVTIIRVPIQLPDSIRSNRMCFISRRILFTHPGFGKQGSFQHHNFPLLLSFKHADWPFPAHEICVHGHVTERNVSRTHLHKSNTSDTSIKDPGSLPKMYLPFSDCRI